MPNVNGRSGHTAIVTGTSAGLGEAVARQLLERGWRVVGIARRTPASLTNAAYHHIAYDLATVADDPSPLAAQLNAEVNGQGVRRLGVVNNAAVAEGLMPVADLDPRSLARIYAVNVIAPVWLMGFAERASQPETALRIVNVSSGAGGRGVPGLAAYGSAKAALRLAGMSLASEWTAPETAATAPQDAAILSYEPGVVDTDMQRYARSRSPEEFPWVGLFLEYQARGVAVPAERPAHEIVEFLESDGAPRFSERRLQM